MARSVTAPTDTDPNAEMALVGYALAAAVALLLLPILPLLAALGLLESASGEEESGSEAETGLGTV